jgi:hypothetical protein
MKCQSAQDDNPMHQSAINMANTCILEYQVTYPTLVAKQQSTLSYGLAYLRHRNTIINKRYNEHTAVTSSYGATAPSTLYTGKRSNTKGRNSVLPAAHTYSRLCTNGYQLAKHSSALTTPPHQNACHVTFPSKPITTSSSAPTSNGNKSPTNVWPKSNSST